VPEGGAIVPLPQPVPARPGLHTPPVRQLVGGGQLGEHDRPVPYRRADDRVPVRPQRVDERAERPYQYGHHVPPPSVPLPTLVEPGAIA